MELPYASSRRTPDRSEIVRRAWDWLTAVVSEIARQETKNRNALCALRQSEANSVRRHSAFHFGSIEGPDLYVLKLSATSRGEHIRRHINPIGPHTEFWVIWNLAACCGLPSIKVPTTANRITGLRHGHTLIHRP